jgi:hypothetical protein
MQGMLPLVIVSTMMIGGAWIVTSIIGLFRQRAHIRTQTNFHNKMIEKFSSAEDFTAFLQSDAGRSFFDNLTSEPSTPLNRILGSIQKGVILFLLGLGLVILGKSFNPEAGGNVMFVIGVISFMIGSGFLVSSAVSYRLAKAWDLISTNPKRAGIDRGSSGS